MSIFDATARIEMQDNGIYFYEQDVLPCSYLFNGNLTIDLSVSYRYSGFGIILAENNGYPFRQADRAYLMKVGYNDFQVQVKKQGHVTTEARNSCVLAPSSEGEVLHLLITMRDQQLTFDWLAETAAGKERRYNLGSYHISGQLNEYRIGFYSNAGNKVHSLTFAQDVPDRWITNIHNTCGGRVRFMKDGFLMENCKNKAEIEQKDILLNPGLYYLRYEKQLINNKNDIECVVMPTNASSRSDEQFEDQNKNLLKADNTLEIKGMPLSVNIKFKGKNGRISNLYLTDSKDGSFIETEDGMKRIDGSYISIDTRGIKEIHWKGEINGIPLFTDYMKDCPYAVLESSKHRVTLEEAGISLGIEYAFIYHVETHLFDVYRKDYTNHITTVVLPIEDNEHHVNLFFNMTALIYELKVIMQNDETIDMIAQKTFQKYIPDSLRGPILVTNSTGEPLDISASYREVMRGETTVAYYTSSMPIQLREGMPYGKMNLKVYGIPEDAVIDPKGTTIEAYASRYELIDDELYHFEGEYFIFPETILQKYPHIAVVYRDTEDYTYWFTNWEREIYENPNGRLTFEHDVVDNDSAILLYGILPGSHTDKTMLYRIPSEKMINSIDLFADAYEIIPSSDYDVNYLNNELILADDIRKKYKGFVIDYLKQDSYAINYDETMQQYAVDISSQDTKTHISYDDTSRYITTGIQADKSKYIILRRDKRG